MVGGGSNEPIVEAPMLAEIARRMNEMPAYMFDGRPYEIEPDMWRAACLEMEQIMEARGYLVCVANLDRPNFLFRGVPIVMSE